MNILKTSLKIIGFGAANMTHVTYGSFPDYKCIQDMSKRSYEKHNVTVFKNLQRYSYPFEYYAKYKLVPIKIYLKDICSERRKFFMYRDEWKNKSIFACRIEYVEGYDYSDQNVLTKDGKAYDIDKMLDYEEKLAISSSINP